MNDRELLELAAKAAGIEGIWNEGFEGEFAGFYRFNEEGRIGTIWLPLTDDGDALRLAVKLGMVVGTYANYSTVDLLSPNDRIETITVWHSSTSNDPYAATRRAIVQAAAEIGKEMK